MASDAELMLTVVETYMRSGGQVPEALRARAQRVAEMLEKAASTAPAEAYRTLDRLFPNARTAPTRPLAPPPGVRDAVRRPFAPAIVNKEALLSVRPSYFSESEPTTFREYVGQENVMDFLTNAVRGLGPEELAIRPVFFIGIAGLGKTTVAKVTAHELQRRAVLHDLPIPEYIEVMPVEVPNVGELDKIMRRVQQRPGSIVFIDEVHALAGKEHFLKLYQALINGRYKFEGEKTAVWLPPTTYFAATTDYGALPDAFMSRFSVQQLRPASPEALKHMVKVQKFPISDPAADMVVERTGATGVPREVLELYHEAVVFAKGAGKGYVGLPEVKRACDNQGIDKHGLRARDRIVIETLFRFPRTRRLRNGGEEFVGYVQSEKTIFTVTQLDPVYYQKNVEPRLISRGFLEIRTNGRALTKKAEQVYKQLIPAPPAPPEPQTPEQPQWPHYTALAPA